MRAVRLHAYGPPDRLVVEDVPEPRLERPNDVRVAVHAASVNPVDWKIRAGSQRGVVRLALPWILGLDVSGEVIEVGPEVTRFEPGDPVYGRQDHRRPGTCAEQCVLQEDLLARKPKSPSHVEAACLPLAGLTAWQCLLPWVAEHDTPRVLVQAGSGGVGTLAIQIAKHHGAWVATTCSARNRDLVLALGADRHVDYREEDWWEVLDDLDFVLDSLGYEERERALRHVNRGGRVASIVSGLPRNTERFGPLVGALVTGLGIAGFWLRGRLRGIQAVSLLQRTRADQLEAMADLVDRGGLRPVLDRVLPLEEVAEAHRYAEAGHVAGKVVLQLR